MHELEFPDCFQKPSVGVEIVQQSLPFGLCLSSVSYDGRQVFPKKEFDMCHSSHSQLHLDIYFPLVRKLFWTLLADYSTRGNLWETSCSTSYNFKKLIVTTASWHGCWKTGVWTNTCLLSGDLRIALIAVVLTTRKERNLWIRLEKKPITLNCIKSRTTPLPFCPSEWTEWL